MGRNGKDRTIRSELLARLLAQGDELLELQEKLVNKDGAQQTDELAVCVDNAMEEMGYVRTFSYDGEDADVRMAVLRYRKYV